MKLLRPKIINVTQVYKYIREYNNTAKEGRPILVFPFFPNWRGLLHRKIQRKCEVNFISFLTVCSTILNHLYCSLALLRLLFVQFCDSVHEGVSRILSTFCLEMKVVLRVHFKAVIRRVCTIQLKLQHLPTISSPSLKYFKA